MSFKEIIIASLFLQGLAALPVPKSISGLPLSSHRWSLITPSTSNGYVNEESVLETYIVLLKQPEGELFTESKDLESWYRSFLPADTLNSNQPRLLHCYRHVVTGFAAKLTADEAKAMEMREELLLARPQRMVPLHTTHTPSFLGLQQNLGFWKSSNYGEGVIIGVWTVE
ncbi:hypothetical protein GH714_026501 [Hevea brasiliensis]|uniref:Inhibitor I9 domain-containing protein n=1 Tax=Hevea brasiliensis TaxID=3981 RepID=A0A6A6LUV2_HEVBR|nr:hypothetical protein GH714_026501 [Hevea brasiliensis]